MIAQDAEAAIAEHEEDRSPAAQAKKIWARAPYIACHGRLSRCKRLPLILDRVSTPAWLATLRPVKPRGSELRLLPNQCSQIADRGSVTTESRQNALPTYLPPGRAATRKKRKERLPTYCGALWGGQNRTYLPIAWGLTVGNRPPIWLVAGTQPRSAGFFDQKRDVSESAPAALYNCTAAAK